MNIIFNKIQLVPCWYKWGRKQLIIACLRSTTGENKSKSEAFSPTVMPSYIMNRGGKEEKRYNWDFMLTQLYSSTVTTPEIGYSIGRFGRQGINYSVNLWNQLVTEQVYKYWDLLTLRLFTGGSYLNNKLGEMKIVVRALKQIGSIHMHALFSFVLFRMI